MTNFLFMIRYYRRHGWTVANSVKTAWKVCRND